MQAACKRDAGLCVFLLHAKAPPLVKSFCGRTALDMALLSDGRTLNPGDSDGDDEAKDGAHKVVIELQKWIQHGQCPTPARRCKSVREAVRRTVDGEGDHVCCLKLLLDGKATADATALQEHTEQTLDVQRFVRSEAYTTPLHQAVRAGKTAVVRLLCRARAGGWLDGWVGGSGGKEGGREGGTRA
jgi:hypothetical protein